MYQSAINAVSHVTGIPEADFLSPSRKWEYVEARMLLTLLLHREGVVDKRIADVIRRQRPTVTVLRHKAEDVIAYSSSLSLKLKKVLKAYEDRQSI